MILTPQMQTVTIDSYTYICAICVPSMKIELSVMSEWSYHLLKRSPCRFAGSYLDDTPDCRTQHVPSLRGATKSEDWRPCGVCRRHGKRDPL